MPRRRLNLPAATKVMTSSVEGALWALNGGLDFC
jgi:hypothetical protein